MTWILLLTALVAGMLLPIQTGINAGLRTFVGSPIMAAAIQFLVGAGALMAIFIAVRGPWPEAAKLSGAPWWIWIGGLCGANYIVTAILLAPRLGAATLMGVSVAGQLLVSLALDHFGLIGYPVHPVSAWRVAGAALLLVGMALIQRF